MFISLLILLSLTNTAEILFADITSAVVVFPKLDIIFENSKVILLFVWYFLQQLTSAESCRIK